MKLKDKVIIAIDRIWTKKVVFFLNVLLAVLSFMLIGQAVHIYNKNTYIINEVNSITQADEDRLYILNINNYNVEDKTLYKRIKGFLTGLSELENVEWSGTYIVGEQILSTDTRYNLGSIYEDYREQGYSDSIEAALSDVYEKYQYINTLNTNLDVLGATGVEFSMEQDKFEITEEYIPALVGAKLADIFPVGSEFDCLGNVHIKVVGVIEKGEKFYGTGIFETPRGYIELDGFIVLPEEVYALNEANAITFNNSIIVYLKNSSKEAVNSVTALAQNYRLDINLVSLKEKYSLIYNENDNINEVLIFVVFIFALTFIAFVVTGIVNILIRKNEIGIFYSCGFTSKDMVIIMLIENIIKVFLAWLFALYRLYHSIAFNEFYDNITKKIEIKVFLKYDMIFLIIVLIIIPILVTIVPKLVLKHLTVREMVSGN